MKTNGGEPTKEFNCEVLKAIKASFIEKFPAGTVPGENFNVEEFLTNALALSSIYGQAIRLAFHDAGEVDLTDPSDQLGSDGCLSADPGNKGIIESTSYVYTLIEPLWQDNCDYLTRADFWALIGKLASEISAKPVDIINLPGEYITIPYQYGRKDNKQCNLGGPGEPKHRLPSGQEGFHGYNGFEAVFLQRMGLTMDDVGMKIYILCIFCCSVYIHKYIYVYIHKYHKINTIHQSFIFILLFLIYLYFIYL
jgi:hypothetical protein